MTIAILEPNVKKSDLQFNLKKYSLHVVLKKEGVDFNVICGNLCEAANVEKSKVKILPEKVLLKIRKETNGEWRELFGKARKDEDETSKKEEDKAITPQSASDETNDGSSGTIPIVDKSKPRPYASTRDWNAIERDIKAQEENEKPEGEEAMNKLFQQIYGNANDDTRRAMVKSFQTSGGTVLSTNW